MKHITIHSSQIGVEKKENRKFTTLRWYSRIVHYGQDKGHHFGLRPGEPLYITEGCSDCWAMLSSGRKAVAIPSATTLHDLSLIHI